MAILALLTIVSCIMEIRITEKLEVTGWARTTFVLPKLIGAGHNRFFTIENGGANHKVANLSNGVSNLNPCGDDDYSDCYGGFVYVKDGGIFTLETVIHGGKATYGGGILANGGVTTIIRSSIAGCSAIAMEVEFILTHIRRVL